MTARHRSRDLPRNRLPIVTPLDPDPLYVEPDPDPEDSGMVVVYLLGAVLVGAGLVIAWLVLR